MKKSIAKALFNSHSYFEYRKLITDLLKRKNLQEVSSPLHWQITVFEWDADESREDIKNNTW
jgi:hypothetical protein